MIAGVFALQVLGTLQVDGHIKVNGAAGTSRAGGGSGGSIWISTDTIRVQEWSFLSSIFMFAL